MNDTSSAHAGASPYALIAGLSALAMWSGTAIANKVAVGYMNGLTAGALRSLIAGSVALVIVVLGRLPLPTRSRDKLLLAVSGFASFAIWPTLMSIGIEHTTASHTAVVMATIPVLTALMSNLLDFRLPHKKWWLGASIALVATALLVGARNSGADSESTRATVLGDLIVFTGGISCAIGYVVGGKLSAKIGSIAVTLWGLVAALFLLVPVFAFSAAPSTGWAGLPFQAWVAIGWMALLSSLAGYGLWFFALGAGGVARISSLQLAMPVVTVVAAALVLGETVTVQILTITGAIIVGTWLAHHHAT
jgi:drug/metabolite transporter (DMT)-like permease